VEHLSLSDAVARHVHKGDAINIVYGHSRWTAAAREVCRQWWGRDAGFSIQMFSLGSLGALFFAGGMVRKVVTAYSGDGFPTSGPNPIYTQAYRSGAVEVEHWSGLTLQQRLEAAARGLPVAVTRSIESSSMSGNTAYQRIDTAFGPVGIMEPLFPDVALLHAPVADRAGNVAISGPLMEGLWAAWAARRGAIVTVEQVVDDLAPWGHLVQLPAHRVLAVVEAPFGAHPGGMFARDLPAESYGEDVEFWIACRTAARDDFTAWAREWCLDLPDQKAYLQKLGTDRLTWLKGRSDPLSWKADADAHPVDETADVTTSERAAVIGAHELARRIHAVGADAVLAGAGVSNLAAWLGVARAREAGAHARLTAEMGLWGYTPTPADPYTFNHRVFPGSEMLTDMSTVLGMLVSGPGTRAIGTLGGAEVDRFGNINSTDIPGSRFLAGSGGANDVASGADECLVVMVANRNRLPADCSYISSPGRAVQAVCTDLGILRKRQDGELHIAAVAFGQEPLAERIRTFAAACGWEVGVDLEVEELPETAMADVLVLRRYDPEGLFLRG
jgi:acyl CoA:acetate/3-ketoacid CoA transferase alpha subunit/acyl CoA:acetate/3-ketoacid CoA transferase beta subunit